MVFAARVRTNALIKGLRICALGAALISCGTAVGAAPAANGGSFFEDFKGIDGRRWYISDGWTNGPQQGCTWSREMVSSGGGMLHLRVKASGHNPESYKCAELQSMARYGYGTYEARMRVASGSALNSAMFTYSGPPLTPHHDEIDFEFLGKNPGGVQLNYYKDAKGGHETIAPVASDATTAFHNYAFVWAPGSVKWYIDGVLVRTATGADLPSTPGKFYLTLWLGSSTVEGWLGKLDPSRIPASADVDWAAYTAAGQTCLFPQSLTCAKP